jgi:hypothetical protein
MDNDAELSEAVLTAIGANRKIDAIKLLRQEQNIGLKEAKDIVDAYISKNPQVLPDQSRRGSFNAVPLLLAAAVTAVAYFAYKSL